MSVHRNLVLTRDDWIRRLRHWGIRPSRSKGQNFLLDPQVVGRIADAAGVSRGDKVLEIGPGMGILSEALLGREADVTAVELDDVLAPRLDEHFRNTEQFRLVHDDATKIDPVALFANDERYIVVANLPYSVATVIIRHLLESEHPPERLVVMVQREVAERMTATNGDLSLLAIATQLYTQPYYLFTVPDTAFHPAPKVTSAVVRLQVRPDPLLEGDSRNRLFELATIAFQQKRKTLLNSLSSGLGVNKTTLADRLASAGLDGSMRPQAFSLDDWLQLAQVDLGTA